MDKQLTVITFKPQHKLAYIFKIALKRCTFYRAQGSVLITVIYYMTVRQRYHLLDQLSAQANNNITRRTRNITAEGTIKLDLISDCSS
jgi:hypothetical protein